jgi:hypothetical protein
MTLVKTALLGAVLIVAGRLPASATPNMIRLGYASCASCHLSPQGGGLLTPYGKGIDAAQTLRPEEVPEVDSAGAMRRIAYDVRFSLALDRDPPAAVGYGFNTSVRSAVMISPRQQVVYATAVASPTLARARTTGAITVRMSKLFWLYQPKEGVSLTVGRDDLPSGLGLPGATSFTRRVNNPDVSTTPTQAKLFWWNQRWQVATYAFGPDGNETAGRFEAYGGGALVGANVWHDRVVLGLTSRLSYADAYDRRNASAFARLGLSKHWGLLLEHDVTSRATSEGPEFTDVAGHSQMFFVPFAWLQAAVAAEHIRTAGGTYTYRLTPSAQVRLNRNVAVSFNTRDVFTGVSAGRSRTYSVQATVKTVQ